MHLLRFNSFDRAILCAVLALLAGCHAPWSPGRALNETADAGAANAVNATDAAGSAIATAEIPKSIDRAGTAMTLPDTRRAKPTASPAESQEPNLADVLAEVQQVGNLDPDAQARLIQELQRTKPEMWPLVTEQFRSTLAYHEKLAANNQQSAGEAQQPESAMKLASWEGKATSDPITLPTVSTDPLTKVDPRATPGAPPSSKIGSLVDPRGVRSAPKYGEAEEAASLASSLPGRAPTEFATPEGASPIGSAEAQDAFQHAPTKVAPIEQRSTPHAAVQARFEADANAQTNAAGVQANVSTSAPSPQITPVGSEPTAIQGDWQSLVAQAADALEGRVAAAPQSTAEVHEHASLRLLRLLAGRTEEALEPIPRISPVEQDYWSRQVFALATYLDHHQQPDGKRRAAASVTHLDDAVAKLRELGSLSLRNLTFCQNVHGYGAYEPYDDNTFSAGQQLSIYLEIENYRSVSTEKGYTTLLGATYEILDDQGTRVDGGEFPKVEDCCRSRRRDFHVQYGLRLPQSLATGEYRLQLVVKDEQSDKIGSAQLRFSVSQ